MPKQSQMPNSPFPQSAVQEFNAMVEAARKEPLPKQRAESKPPLVLDDPMTDLQELARVLEK